MLSTVCVWVSFQHCHLTSVYDYLVLEKCKIPRRGSALCLITAVTQPSVAQKVILSARLSVILILVLFANSELSLSVWRTSSGVPHSWSMSMHVQLCIISTGYLRFRQTTNIHLCSKYLPIWGTPLEEDCWSLMDAGDGEERSHCPGSQSTVPPHTCPVSCVHSSHNTHSLGFLPSCCFTVSYTLFCKNLYFVLTVVDCISVIESLYPEPCLLSMLLACVCWCQKNAKMIGDRKLVFSITSFNGEMQTKIWLYTVPALQIWSM